MSKSISFGDDSQTLNGSSKRMSMRDSQNLSGSVDGTQSGTTNQSSSSMRSVHVLHLSVRLLGGAGREQLTGGGREGKGFSCVSIYSGWRWRGLHRGRVILLLCVHTVGVGEKLYRHRVRKSVSQRKITNRKIIYENREGVTRRTSPHYPFGWAPRAPLESSPHQPHENGERNEEPSRCL